MTTARLLPLLTFLGLSVPAAAQVSFPVSITCTSTGQLCTPPYTATVNVPQAGTMVMNYNIPENACASWKIHFYVDNQPLGTSGFLAPPILTPGPVNAIVTAGSHIIGLQAEGETGGCDTGTLTSWGGLLLITLPSAQTAPPPTITGLSPSSAVPGAPGFTLTVNGSGFLSTATVLWSGIQLATTFVNPNQLTAVVPASLLNNPGTANIAVINVTGGIPSPPIPFPIAQSVTPTISSVFNGAAGMQLCPGAAAIVNGTNLGFNGPVGSATVTFGGKVGYVTAGSSTSLMVQIPFEAPIGQIAAAVTVNGVASAPVNVTLGQYCPAIFTLGGPAAGYANVIDQTAMSPVQPNTPAKPGDALQLFATGLGQTNPASSTGQTQPEPAGTVVTMTIGGVTIPQSSMSFVGSGGGPPGYYNIKFTLPNTVQGVQPVILTVGGVSSPPANLAITGISALVSNASFGSAGTAAPGEIVSIFASNLGKTDQTTGFPSSDFQGVQVTFDGTAAPLFHLVTSVTPQQIDLLVPEELPTSGTVNVQLSTPTSVGANYVLNMAPAVPGWYRLPDPSDPGRFNVIAQFANSTWLAMPVSMTAAMMLPACSTVTSMLTWCGQPAEVGDYLVLYATGLGKTTPGGDPSGVPLATGQIPPVNGSVLYETIGKPTITIGGVTAQVLYSGLAPGFPGEYQVDVQVPSGVANGDDVPVVITMGGLTDMATISVQPRY